MIPHDVHIVHICMTEIKKYNVRAHAYSMVVLVIRHEVEAWI